MRASPELRLGGSFIISARLSCVLLAMTGGREQDLRSHSGGFLQAVNKGRKPLVFFTTLGGGVPFRMGPFEQLDVPLAAALSH